VKPNYCLRGLDLCDTTLVFLQLVFVAAKLGGTDYVFVAMILDFVQNCFELARFTRTANHSAVEAGRGNTQKEPSGRADSAPTCLERRT